MKEDKGWGTGDKRLIALQERGEYRRRGDGLKLVLKVRMLFHFLLFLPYSFQRELHGIIIYLFCLCDNCTDNLL